MTYWKFTYCPPRRMFVGRSRPLVRARVNTPALGWRAGRTRFSIGAGERASMSGSDPQTFDGAALKALVPAGHEIVLMLDSKEGCRVFTSSKPGEGGWEHEVLIPRDRLVPRDGCVAECPTTRTRSCRAA